MTHLIRGCQLDAGTGGLVIEYLTPAKDVRTNGMVLNHALLVPPEDAFTELLVEVELVLQRTLSAALELFEAAPELEAAAEDEGPSPYDNPEER